MEVVALVIIFTFVTMLVVLSIVVSICAACLTLKCGSAAVCNTVKRAVRFLLEK